MKWILKILPTKQDGPLLTLIKFIDGCCMHYVKRLMAAKHIVFVARYFKNGIFFLPAPRVKWLELWRAQFCLLQLKFFNLHNPKSDLNYRK